MIRWARWATLLAAIAVLMTLVLDFDAPRDLKAAGSQLWSQRTDPDLALRLASRALLLGGLSDQETCRAHELRAEAGLRLRNQAFALRELDRALAACPERASALLLRGRLRLAAGKPAEALADLDQGLASNQGKAPGKKLALPHALRGQARMALGRIEAAGQDAKTALALNPREPEAHYLQSLIWEARQQPQAALLSMETAYKLKFRPGGTMPFMSAQGKAWGRRLVILRMKVQKNRPSAK